MERGRKIETPRKTFDIRNAVLRIRRLQHLADVFEMMNHPEDARSLQVRALNVAVRIIGVTAENGRNQRMLDSIMQRLRDRDGEMHGRIEAVLAQARAVKTTTEKVNETKR